MMKSNAMPMQDLNLKIALYKTSVLLLVIRLTLIKLIIDLLNFQIDTAVEMHHVIALMTEILPHVTDIAPILVTDTNTNETLLLHSITDLDFTTIDEIQVHIVLITDLPIDHLIDAFRVLDTDHVLIQGTNHLNNKLLHTDLHQRLEILDHFDLYHSLKQKPS